MESRGESPTVAEIMSAPAYDVCGGDHRIALVAMGDEALGYWKTTALLAATPASLLGAS